MKKIVQVWNPILMKETKKVKDCKKEKVKKIIDNLIEIMRISDLVWISANQIWEDLSIFVSEIRKTKNRNPKKLDKLRIFINPKIIYKSKKTKIDYEWCWSVANSWLFWPVERAEIVKIEALNENWEKFILEAKWFLSRIIQHEIDHLKWHIFLEKITDIKKIINSNDFKKYAKKNT